jgi:hypothetical protein
MACPLPQPDPSALERPPARGWYWNANHLARAWLPLIGPEGLGLLDFYLASADYRPGAPAPGWAAVTLDELARLTGWGRARLVRLNRLLAAAGLLTVRHRPVPGRGPAVQRAFYRVERQAPPPTVATLARLAPLAERDPALAARLRRYTPPAPPDAAQPVTPAPDPEPVPAAAPAPVPARHRSVDTSQTAESTTTTSARAGVTITKAIRQPEPVVPAIAVPPPVGEYAPRDERPATTDAAEAALDLWRAANGRAASPLERQRLAQLAALAARAGGDRAAGWARVGAAIAEAVEAGSAYVAPRRVARILERWLAEEQAAARLAGPAPAPAERSHPTQEPVRPSAAAGVGPAAALERDEPAAGTPATGAAVPDDPVWQPPATIDGLPAAPAAVLRAALAAAGLTADPYLRGAALAGWAEATGGPPALLVATPAPAPPAVVARLEPRLSQGLRAVLGRSVAGRLTPVAALVAA